MEPSASNLQPGVVGDVRQRKSVANPRPEIQNVAASSLSQPPPGVQDGILNKILNSLASIQNWRIPSQITCPTPDIAGCTACFRDCSSFFTGLTRNAGVGVGSLAMGLNNVIDWSSQAGTRIQEKLQQNAPQLASLFVNLQFRFPMYRPRPDQADHLTDFLIMNSQENSVQYFSQDMIDQMKLKIVLKKVNTLATDRQKQKNASLQPKKKKGKKLEETLIDLDDDNEFEESVAVFQWQQKVFSSRELLYYLNRPESRKDPFLVQNYRQEIRNIKTLCEENMFDEETLMAYRQLIEMVVPEEKTANKKKKKSKSKKKKKKKEGDSESNLSSPTSEDNQMQLEEDVPTSPQQQEDEDEARSETKPTPIRQQKKPTSLTDIIKHRLFTYTNNDGIFVNGLFEPIECSSDADYPVQPSNTMNSVQTMMVMASFGKIKKSATEMNWVGEEYPLCAITAFPDGSFIMKPGLSVVEEEDDDDEELDEETIQLKKIQQRYLDEISLIKKKVEKKYFFRTKSGEAYEFTIHLFNEQKKDKVIEKFRKKILKQMHDRALAMRRNLVGMDFTRLSGCRIYYNGEIVSGENFDANEYCVRYRFEPPSHSAYQVENIENQRLVSATQFSRSCNEGSIFGPTQVAIFSFPFEFQVLRNETNIPPKLLLEVIAKDWQGRHRVEGYGYISMPLQSGSYEYEVPTWKPQANIRSEVKSFFVGGSVELEDASYVAYPKHFHETFLNKYGFMTTPSGTLRVRVQTIIQESQS